MAWAGNVISGMFSRPPNMPTSTSLPPRPRQAMSLAAVAVLFTTSTMAFSGPPAASLIRSATPSPDPSTTLVAPAVSAAWRLSSEMSTQTMFRCPSAFRISMAERPRPPAPTTRMARSGGCGISFWIAE